MTGRFDFETEFSIDFGKMHYDNTPRGVGAIYCEFNGCKTGNFQMKIVTFPKFCSKHR